jgi:hypothetical protein
MLSDRFLGRIDPNTVIIVITPIYSAGLELHFSGVVELPPFLVWASLFGLAAGAVHLVRLAFDRGYRAKLDAHSAQRKANRLAGRPQLTPEQTKRALVLTLVIGASVTVYRLLVEGAPVAATTIASVAMLAGFFVVHRRNDGV